MASLVAARALEGFPNLVLYAATTWALVMAFSCSRVNWPLAWETDIVGGDVAPAGLEARTASAKETLRDFPTMNHVCSSSWWSLAEEWVVLPALVLSELWEMALTGAMEELVSAA